MVRFRKTGGDDSMGIQSTNAGRLVRINIAPSGSGKQGRLIGAIGAVFLLRAISAAEGAPGLDEQDLVVLCPARPVLVRLHLQVARKPFLEPWRESQLKRFSLADKDNNGKLEKTERAGNFSGTGVLSREAFLELMWNKEPPIEIRYDYGRSRGGAALFSLLDRNRDQTISADELTQVDRIIPRRDFDGDGSLSEDELTSFSGSTAGANPAAGVVLLVNQRQMSNEQATRLLGAYASATGTDQVGASLRSSDFALAPEVFSALDRTGDGRLEVTELSRFADRPADLELEIGLGRGSRPGSFRLASWANAGKLGVSADSRSDGGFDINTQDAQITFRRNNRDPAQVDNDRKRLQEFDKDNNGYLTANELAGAGPFEKSFLQMDADSDGKVFAQEFNDFVDRQAQMVAAKLVIEVVDEGQTLFDMLDANGDGRLSRRELGSASSLLELDRDGNKGISLAESPRRVRLELSRGGRPMAETPRERGPGASRRTRANASDGPEWFANMDTNRDGDLTPGEFLGSRADFDRLDRDQNGVIDASEAEKYGKR